MWGTDGGKKKGSAMTSDDEVFTFLGQGDYVKGTIQSEGSIRIDGRVEGEIHAKGTVTIAEHGLITGEIMASTVICSGRINGNVTAREKVHLLKPGELIGNIQTPSVVLEEGSHFQGMCDMGAHARPELEHHPDTNAVAREGALAEGST